MHAIPIGVESFEYEEEAAAARDISSKCRSIRHTSLAVSTLGTATVSTPAAALTIDAGAIVLHRVPHMYLKASATLVPNGQHPALLLGDKYWSVGDIVRKGDELRRILSIAAATGILTFHDGFTSTVSDAIFKQNMFEYRIKFETGCTKDSHCTANGVDSTDSDQDAWCSLGGVCRCWNRCWCYRTTQSTTHVLKSFRYFST